MSEEQLMKEELDNLIKLYKESDELKFLGERDLEKFDIKGMPDIIQKMSKLVTTKAPSFSNISAVSISNFVLAGLFGQLRPRIIDSVYSSDELGINYFGLTLAASGRGKDSSYQALFKASKKAKAFVTSLKEGEVIDKARKSFVYSMKQDNPDFDESSVKQEDYQDIIDSMIKKIEPETSDIKSSRGGITTSLNRMNKSSYGTVSIFSSELSMSIESSPFPPEVLELCATTFDMGEAQVSTFKTEDSKEEAITGAYMNLLAISNASSFYVNGPTRNVMLPKLRGAFLRRMFIISSTNKEEMENVYIPKSPYERRQMQAEARIIVQEYTQEIDAHLLNCIEELADDKTITFNDDASDLYDDYKALTEAISQRLTLDDSNSTEATEIGGKAFRMGRLAAIYAMAQNKRVVDYETMKSAILFTDHSSVHSKRLMKTLKLEAYELMLLHWEEGTFGNILSLANAITAGYITTRQTSTQAIQTFLNPANSRLKGEATVTYNESIHSFVFNKIVKVKSDEGYSLNLTKGHVEEVKGIVENKTLSIFSNMLSKESSFNPFIDDNTKFVSINVDKSFLSIHQINKFFANVIHYISTKSDIDDEHSFTVIVPLSTVISKKEYKFVCLSIAQQLMLKVLPEQHENTTISHGYAGSNVLTGLPNAELFDCSGIQSNFASGSDTPLIASKVDKALTATQISKFVKEEFTELKSEIIDMFNCSASPLLLMAGFYYDFKMNGIPDQKIEDLINNLNSELETSLSEAAIADYVIAPFVNL